MVSATDCPQLNSIHVPESNIGSHFGALLDNMEGSDVTFDVAGEKFPAHKLVLGTRSREFRSKFCNDLDMGKQEIIVTDLEPKVFKVKTIYFILFFPFLFRFHCCIGYGSPPSHSLHPLYLYIVFFLFYPSSFCSLSFLPLYLAGEDPHT